MTAAEDFTAALLAAVHNGQRPPCANSSDAWMSEDRDQRAAAAHQCAGCQLLTVCGAFAKEIRPSFGTWAGRDWTKPTRKARTR